LLQLDTGGKKGASHNPSRALSFDYQNTWVIESAWALAIPSNSYAATWAQFNHVAELDQLAKLAPINMFSLKLQRANSFMSLYSTSVILLENR
jgi:hypothetical protein